MAETEGWLEDFEAEVDSALKGRDPARASSDAESRAAADFERWWSELSDAAESAPEELRAELSRLRDEALELRGELDALKAGAGARAVEERERELAALKEQVGRFQEQNKALERALGEAAEAKAALQSRSAEARVKASRAQEGYESHILGMKERVAGLEAQARALEDGKRILGEQAALSTLRCESLESELRASRDARSRLERRCVELEFELQAARESLARCEAALARSEGAADELRQASAGARPLDAVSRIAPDLSEIERRQESRLREALAYLEDKIKGVDESGAARLEDLRELLQALARQRRGQGEEP